jgi:hypothetical protein
MVTKNVGWRDAAIRGFLGGLLLLWSAALQDHPFAALGLGFIGLIVIGTALFRICPLYTALGITTGRSRR